MANIQNLVKFYCMQHTLYQSEPSELDLHTVTLFYPFSKSSIFNKQFHVDSQTFLGI
jgi:hypothetical protein